MASVTQVLKSVFSNKKLQYTVASLCIFFLLLNYAIMPAYVHHGGTLAVPRVTGLKFEEARRVLDSAGLEPVQADSRPDPQQPPGTVVAQIPQADDKVKYGRRVYLSISEGEALVAVPALRGRSTRDAKITLERSGLHLGQTEYATSEMYPENTIIGQAVQPGASVAKGSSIGITVSRGKETQESIVPELTGKTLTEAEKQLAQHGLKVGNITYQSSFDLLPNTVVDQFPRAGEPVPGGQAVDLFVVKVGKPVEEIHPPKH